MQRSEKHRPRGGIKPLVVRVYDNVNLALWATLIAGLIFLGVFGIHPMPAGETRYEAQQARTIEAEDAFYCNKWGMAAGSGKHRICMSDLRQLRRSVESRLADESFF